MPLRCAKIANNTLKEILKLDYPRLECFQLSPSDKGVLYSESDGQVYWTTSVDEQLGSLLRSSKEERRPTTISLGTHGRYFIRFSNGDVYYALMKLDEVAMVAFGSAQNSHAVVYSNGRTACSNVPAEVSKTLADRSDGDAKLEFIALGEGGQYFMKFERDEIWYGNLGQAVHEAFSTCPGIIKKVSFGPRDSAVVYFVSQGEPST